MSARATQALELIRERPGITIPELADAMAIKQNYLYRMLPGMQEQGTVFRSGRGWHHRENGQTEQLPVFDANGRPDEHWEQFRARATASDWGLPKGTYDATVMSARVLRRRDNGEWGIRIVFRADRLGLDGFTWRPLSKNTADPLDLTSSQIRSLREWAVKLAIGSTVPAEIVASVDVLVGQKVEARVSRTPVGSRASLARNAAPVSHPSASSPAVIEASDVTRSAHDAHEQLLLATQNMRGLSMVVARACHQLRVAEGWQHLGYSSLNEYLAQPELGMSRRTFMYLAAIWDTFHVKGGIPVERLVEADWTKLAETLRAVGAGACTTEDAISDAIALGFRDLREKYQAGNGESGDGKLLDERVSDVIVAPMIDPDRGRMLQVRIGDRLAELDRPHAEKLHSTVGDWLSVRGEA